MTLEKALEISQNIIVEKTTYLNTLEYEAKRMKETDLHAASIEAELKRPEKRLRQWRLSMEGCRYTGMLHNRRE